MRARCRRGRPPRLLRAHPVDRAASALTMAAELPGEPSSVQYVPVRFRCY